MSLLLGLFYVALVQTVAAVNGENRTVSDVFGCMKSGIDSCMKNCSNLVPATMKPAFELCLRNNPVSALKECFIAGGITEKSNCFELPKLDYNPQGSMTDFYSCQKNCTQQLSCDKGCSPVGANAEATIIRSCLRGHYGKFSLCLYANKAMFKK